MMITVSFGLMRCKPYEFIGIATHNVRASVRIQSEHLYVCGREWLVDLYNRNIKEDLIELPCMLYALMLHK